MRMLWVVAGIGVLLFALFLATRRAAVPATWEKVEGEPEPWEAAAIFDVWRLERRLASSEALSPEFRTTPEEAARLRALWRERRLLVDSSEPGIEARDVAEAVAIAHGLPGWR